jgi:hypothetical protein
MGCFDRRACATGIAFAGGRGRVWSRTAIAIRRILAALAGTAAATATASAATAALTTFIAIIDGSLTFWPRCTFSALS